MDVSLPPHLPVFAGSVGVLVAPVSSRRRPSLAWHHLRRLGSSGASGPSATSPASTRDLVRLVRCRLPLRAPAPRRGRLSVPPPPLREGDRLYGPWPDPHLVGPARAEVRGGRRDPSRTSSPGLGPWLRGSAPGPPHPQPRPGRLVQMPPAAHHLHPTPFLRLVVGAR